MNIKRLPLIIYLLLFVLVLPGWRFHQTNSETYQSQIAQKPRVRFAITLDKNGDPICQVDLAEYPELVPNFAQLNTTNTAEQAHQLQQEPASIIEGIDLPPCAGEYLNRLKHIAENNIVLNSDKPPIHKAGWKKNVVAGVAGCILGTGATTLGTDMNPIIEIGSLITGLSSSSIALTESVEAKITTQKLEKTKKQPWINRNKQNKLKEEISKLKKYRPVQLAIAGVSLCYLGTGVVTYTE